MSDHLPECEYPDPEMLPGECPTCRMLRACEERVDEHWKRLWDAYATGLREELLDAAREAVVPQNVRSAYLVSLSPQEQRIAVSALELAARAIDALREEQK